MTTVARRVASIPARSAGDTWAVISGILAPDRSSEPRKELERVAGVASMLLSSEAPAGSPIIAIGDGPRVRIYCVFGEDAVLGHDVNEEPLVTTPLQGNWTLSLPCPTEDLKWASEELGRLSHRVMARPIGSEVPEVDAPAKSAAAPGQVDKEAFFKP